MLFGEAEAKGCGGAVREMIRLMGHNLRTARSPGMGCVVSEWVMLG